MYLGWAPEGADRHEWCGRLVDSLAPALIDHGVRALTISVADARSDGSTVAVLGVDGPPKDAMVSFWLDASAERGPVEAVLRESFGRLEGYLVVESVPIRSSATDDGLAPGVTQITSLAHGPTLDREQFIHRWQNEFVHTAIECQRTTAYVRNEVVRPLTDGAAPWTSIVEETFPIEALDDPAVFYDAEGDEQLLAEHQQRLFSDVSQLLDLSRIDVRCYSEYRFGHPID